MERDGMARELSEQDLQLLSQYLDGELSPIRSQALETRLKSESSLQAVLQNMRRLDEQLREVFAENPSIPSGVAALLSTSGLSNSSAVSESSSGDAAADPIGNATDKGATILQFPRRAQESADSDKPRWAYALAASFVGAIALAFLTNLDRTPENGLPGSDSRVASALDQLPSGNDWASLGDGREIQPVLTFPHQDGRWCREYLLRGGASDWRAVSCREDGQWVTQAAGLESYLEPADAYRPAGAADSAPVAVFISQHAADIALGGEAEAALINGGWQRN